jgi:rare lipoprotein A
VEVESILADEVPVVAAARPVPPLPHRPRPPLAAKAPAPAVMAAPAADPLPAAAGSGGGVGAASAPAPAPGPVVAGIPPVGPPPAPAASASMLPAAVAGKGAFLQLGVFSTLANAEGFRNHVREELAWLGSRLELLAENGRYRLHAGPYASAEEAQSTAARIAAALKLKPFLVWR